MLHEDAHERLTVCHAPIEAGIHDGPADGGNERILGHTSLMRNNANLPNTLKTRFLYIPAGFWRLLGSGHMGMRDVSSKVQNIVYAVIFVVIGIIGMVIVANAVANEVSTIQDTSQNVSENLTQGDWGSDTANSLSQTLGDLTPLAFLGWTIGLVLLPLGAGVFFAYRAIQGA